MNCQHCQSLLLDHLYGLLDGAEAASVDAHLASCPACAAARAETGRVQGLIARAAKSAFPNTRFEAPAPTPAPQQTKSNRTPAPGKPTVLPFPAPAATTTKPARKTSRFAQRAAAIIPWAVAAGVLLAIPGTVVPVVGMFDRARDATAQAQTAKHEADSADVAARTVQQRREKALSDAEYAYTTTKQAEIAIADQWMKDQKAALAKADARKLAVDVYKPQTIQPGAPNDFVVVVRDSRERWESIDKRMVAEVHAVDASDAVIFTQALDHERKGDVHPLRLPAAAWAKVKPEAELYLVVAQVDDKTGARTELQEKVKLAGPVFTTLLVTDKPTYRPGERLFFRSLTLDRVTFRPPTREQILKYELLKSDGTAVSGLSVTGNTDLVRVGESGKVEPVVSDGKPVRGVGCGEFVLPPDLQDGDYTLVLREQQHPGGFPATVPVPVTRAVKVRGAGADQYRKQIEFAGASFAPGETVTAWAELKFQDRPVSGAAIDAVALTIDGQQVAGVEAAKETDKDGRAALRFKLPDEVLAGDVRLKVTFRSALGVETVARHVPVVGNKLKVDFFPECGDNLVAGVPCKVYVRATTPAGQAADIRGVVTDGRRVLAKVESIRDDSQPGANRGIASFTYTPELGAPVWLKLESPAGVYAPIMEGVPVSKAATALLGGAGATAARTGFLLPAPTPDGVVMSVLDPVTVPGQPFRVQLHSVGKTRALVVGAYTRGKLSDTKKVTVTTDRPEIVPLMAGADPRGGVVRITCFEDVDDGAERNEKDGKLTEPKADMKPVAERLVFRKPGEVLNIAIASAGGDTAAMPLIGPAVPAPPPVLPVPQPGVPPRPAPPPAAVPQPIPPVAPGTVGNPPLPAPAVPTGSSMNLSISATDEKGNPVAAILYAAAVNSGVAAGAKDRKMPTHFLLAGEVKHPDDLEYADFLLTDHPKAADALDLVLGTQGWRRFAEQVAPPPTVPAPAPGVGFPPVKVQPQQNQAAPDPELTRVQIQNGTYWAATEPPTVRDNRELQRKYSAKYEAAVAAAAKAKAALESTRDDNRDTAAVATAAAAADSAKRAADEKAARAESAREPVSRFRANVWFGVGALALLALCCGLFAVRRSDGRLPLGFSTLGSLGLAAFLVIAAGWDDRASAAAPRPVGDADRQESKVALAPAPHEAPAPLPPKAPAPGASGVEMTGSKGDAPADKLQMDNTPARGASTVVMNPTLRDVPRPVVVYPAQGYAYGRATTAPKTSFGAAGGGLGPNAPPAGGVPPFPAHPEPKPVALPPGNPATPAPPLVAPGGPGWDPDRGPGGVSAADIAKSKDASFFGPAKRTNYAERAVAQAESLKKAGEMANRAATDRAVTLTEAIDKYLSERGKGKGSFVPPKLATKPDLGDFAAKQVREAVNVVVPPLVVREFAAPRPAPAPLPDAPDSPDTVLWQPVIVLPSDGKTTLSFHLGTASGYQIDVAGHTADGRLGAARLHVSAFPTRSNNPFGPDAQVAPGGTVPPKVPVAPGPQPMP